MTTNHITTQHMLDTDDFSFTSLLRRDPDEYGSMLRMRKTFDNFNNLLSSYETTQSQTTQNTRKISIFTFMTNITIHDRPTFIRHSHSFNKSTPNYQFAQ